MKSAGRVLSRRVSRLIQGKSWNYQKLSTMNTKNIRNTAFQLHHWLGLVGGIFRGIAGLTGSVLVFWHEIDELVLVQRFGKIVPASNRLPIPAFINQIKATYTAVMSDAEWIREEAGSQ